LPFQVVERRHQQPLGKVATRAKYDNGARFGRFDTGARLFHATHVSCGRLNSSFLLKQRDKHGAQPIRRLSQI
jgi:hypothetical protein